MATQTRLPTGDGTSIGHTPSAGAAWECVDDAVGAPDDDATYINIVGGNAISWFTFTPFSIAASAISHLSIIFRSRNSGTTNARSTLIIGTTEYTATSALHAQTGSYTDVAQDYFTNPDTGLAWTEADIEGTGANPLTEFGWRNQANTGAEIDRCTQIYAMVQYTEAGGGGLSIPIAYHHYQQMHNS
jgi:hypothetical protein